MAAMTQGGGFVGCVYTFCSSVYGVGFVSRT
jgi:hypothetical protein